MLYADEQGVTLNSVRFPGAIDSKFTERLEWSNPAERNTLPTYRVMDSDGIIVNRDKPFEMSNDEVVKLYKDMLTSKILLHRFRSRT